MATSGDHEKADDRTVKGRDSADCRREYELICRPVVRRIAIPASVLSPQAGRTVCLRNVVLRLDTGELVAPDLIEGVLALGGQPVTPLGGGCEWRIPATAAGQAGTLRLTVVYGGTEYRDAYAIEVRR